MYANPREAVGNCSATMHENERDQRQFIRAPEYANVREPVKDQRPRETDSANCQRSIDKSRFVNLRRNARDYCNAYSCKPYSTSKTPVNAFQEPKDERKPKVKQSLVHTNSAMRQEFMEYLEYYRCLKAGRFDCTICSAKLANRQAVIKHCSQYHGNRELPKYLKKPPVVMSMKLMAHCKAKHCIFCGSQCESMDRIKLHLMKWHGVEIHVCAVRDCSNVCLHKESLRKHVMEVHRQL